MISRGDIVFPKNREISEELKILILKMLEKDPSIRITCKDLKNDQWINKNREDLNKPIT